MFRCQFDIHVAVRSIHVRLYIMQRKPFDFFETKDSRNEDNCLFQRSEDGRPQLGEAQPAVHRRVRNKNRINLDINDSWRTRTIDKTIIKVKKAFFFRRVLDAEGPFRDVRQRVYPGLFNDTDRWHWTGISSEQQTYGIKSLVEGQKFAPSIFWEGPHTLSRNATIPWCNFNAPMNYVYLSQYR